MAKFNGIQGLREIKVAPRKKKATPRVVPATPDTSLVWREECGCVCTEDPKGPSVSHYDGHQFRCWIKPCEIHRANPYTPESMKTSPVVRRNERMQSCRAVEVRVTFVKGKRSHRGKFMPDEFLGEIVGGSIPDADDFAQYGESQEDVVMQIAGALRVAGYLFDLSVAKRVYTRGLKRSKKATKKSSKRNARE